MAQFICPHCSYTHQAPDAYIGRAAKCNACGGKGRVQEDNTTTTPAPPSETTSDTISPIESPGISTSLQFLAYMTTTCGIIFGIGIALSNDGSGAAVGAGAAVGVAGILSGAFLAGLAQIIDNTNASAIRLARIEKLLESRNEPK